VESGKWKVKNQHKVNSQFFAFPTFYFLLSTFLIFSVPFVFAQESDNDKIDVKADVIEYQEQGRLIVGKGHVVATYQEVRLEAPEASVQVDAKIVLCKGRSVVHQGGITYEGDDLVYDFEKKSGQALNARIKAPPLYAGGEKVEQKGPGEFEIEKGYMTTCDLDEPHYKITTKHITIHSGDKVSAHNAVIWAGPVPVMFVPSYTHSVSSKRPKLSAVGGHRKEWGNFLLTSWNYELTSGIKGDLLIDERQDLGQGYGTGFDYQTRSFGGGHSKIYYTHEHRKSLYEGGSSERERYQSSLRHDWKMGSNTRTFFEYNKRSNSSFVKDYFVREYEKENHPETHWDWVHHEGIGSAELYARKRANHFENVTERLPEARWHLNSLKLFETPLYYTSDATLTNFEKKDAKLKTSDDVFRSDFFNKTELPFRAAQWLNVDPYVGIRETVYSRGANQKDALTRGIFLTGVDLNSRFSKIYDRSIPIRHVMAPQVKYEYLSSPTVSKGKIVNMGGPDDLDRTSRMNFSIEQKLQTKRANREEDSEIQDLARLFMTTSYDFETQQGGRFSTASADLELRPKEGIALDADAQFDLPSKDFLVFNLDLRVEPDRGPRWILGHRYLQNNSVQETFEMTTKLTPKWEARVYERFNVKSFRENGSKRINEFLEQEYTLVRDLHCWEAEVNYNVGSGEEFWLIFRLKGLKDLSDALKQRSYPPSPGQG